MKNLLPCYIFKPGTKFIVTPEVKETTFSPGTTAFMAYMREPDMDYQDVVRIRAVVVRRGKGGMDRLNFNNMSIPVFNDERMLKHDNYLPVGKKHYVHIEEAPIAVTNVMEMSDMDFLGWASARAISLQYFTANMAKKGAPKLWPKNNAAMPLVVASRLNDYFESDKESSIIKFGKNLTFREEFIKEIRFLEAAAIKCYVVYQKLVASAVLNSARFMTYTNDKYFEVVDKKQAKNTIDFYDKKVKWLNKMTINTGKKK